MPRLFCGSASTAALLIVVSSVACVCLLLPVCVPGCSVKLAKCRMASPTLGLFVALLCAVPLLSWSCLGAHNARKFSADCLLFCLPASVCSALSCCDLWVAAACAAVALLVCPLLPVLCASCPCLVPGCPCCCRRLLRPWSSLSVPVPSTPWHGAAALNARPCSLPSSCPFPC